MVKVLIIGGGIAGLTCARALELKGFEVTICEQNSELTSQGAGITLWPNALLSLREIDSELEKSIINSGSSYFGGKIFTSKGTVLSNNDFTELFSSLDSTAIGIHRAELIAELRKSLKNTKLITSRKCISIYQDENSVTATFSDDSEITTDILIGADGINSVVRNYLIPELEKRYAGYYAWRGVVKISINQLENIQMNIGESWGNGKRFGLVMISNDLVYWFSTENRPENNEKPLFSKDYLLQEFKNWHGVIPEILNSTKEEDILYNPIYDLKPFNNWSNGRILLVGDAAHATTPNMGQGGCISIEDAFILGECFSYYVNQEKISITDIRKIFEDYEKLRIKKTSMIQNNSWRIGSIGQWSNRFSVGLRNTILRLIPNRIANQKFKNIMKLPSLLQKQ